MNLTWVLVHENIEGLIDPFLAKPHEVVLERNINNSMARIHQCVCYASYYEWVGPHPHPQLLPDTVLTKQSKTMRNDDTWWTGCNVFVHVCLCVGGCLHMALLCCVDEKKAITNSHHPLSTTHKPPDCSLFKHTYIMLVFSRHKHDIVFDSSSQPPNQ